MKVSRSIELKAPASDVWAFIRDFNNFAAWQPHIDRIEPTDTPGERIVHMKRGNAVRDRIVELDDQARTLSYSMLPNEAPPPGMPNLSDMLAVFVVSEAGQGSKVEYAVSVTVPPDFEPMAQVGIGADIDGALQGLAAHFGG